MKKGWLQRGMALFLVLLCLLGRGTARGDETQALSYEELIELIAETVPAGEDDWLEYLVLPDDFVMPGQEEFRLLLVGIDVHNINQQGRSDTIMLAQINAKKGTIKLVSFLRDTYVSIPGQGSTRINAAYAYGGIKLLKKTLKQNFRLDVDAYVVVNFSLMVDLIDQIGGVEVEISEKELGPLNGILGYYNYQNGIPEEDGFLATAGLQTLSGKQALSFSRIRKIDSDMMRAQRQRIVVEAAFRKIVDLSFNEIVDLVMANIDQVITDLTLADALELVPVALRAKHATFESMQVPKGNAYTSETIRGMMVLVPDLNRCVSQLSKFLAEE